MALFLVACSKDSDSGNSQNDQPVKIGIAWRADVTSEFYTNVVRALKEAGAEPVLLPQVIFDDFILDSETLISMYFDENNILLQQYASMPCQVSGMLSKVGAMSSPPVNTTAFTSLTAPPAFDSSISFMTMSAYC